jgi:hypothetical protein
MDHSNRPSNLTWLSPTYIVLLGFLVFIGFFLITEHGAHLLGILPWLLLLACPLMHIFHSHGHHHEENGDDKDKKNRETHHN